MKNISFFLLIIFFSCQQQEEKKEEVYWDDQMSSDMNKVFAEEEHQRIESFLVRRPDWNMTTTESGLRYMIYEKVDSGYLAQAGLIAEVTFTISLLDGTVCYTSDGETESFLIEKDDVESGLHEGIKYMKVGEKAKFILPSHLAHGLIGDREKIPMLSALIYDLHLKNLSIP